MAASTHRIFFVSLLLTGFSLLFFPPPAAADVRSTRHEIEGSAGIASPATRRAAFSNPAGIAYADGLMGSAELRFPGDSFGDPSLVGGVHYGDGAFGVGAGVATAQTRGYFGMGIFSRELRLGLGVSGFRSFSSGSDGSHFTLGVLAIASPVLRFGLVAYDFAGTPEWAGGASWDVASSVSLSMDVSYGSASGLWAGPGVVFRAQSAALSVAYGIPFSSEGERSLSALLPSGFSVGGAVALRERLVLETRYKRLGADFRYMAGVALKF